MPSDKPSKEVNSKTKSSKEKYIRYSTALVNFICQKVEEGMSIKELCEKHRAKVPAERTIYTWKAKKPEFKKRLEDSMFIRFWVKNDQMEAVLSAKPLTPAQIDIEYECNGNPMLIKHYSTLHEKRKDILLRKHAADLNLASRVMPQLNDKQTVQHEGLENLGPQIVIQNYSDAKIEKPNEKIVNSIEVDKDD